MLGPLKRMQLARKVCRYGASVYKDLRFTVLFTEPIGLEDGRCSLIWNFNCIIRIFQQSILQRRPI